MDVAPFHGRAMCALCSIHNFFLQKMWFILNFMVVHYVNTSEIKIKYSLIVNLHMFVISTDTTEFAHCLSNYVYYLIYSSCCVFYLENGRTTNSFETWSANQTLCSCRSSSLARSKSLQSRSVICQGAE